MTGMRTYVADLPEAGKPSGQCPECGPHGNRGAVTLLWSIVPCIECNFRADDVAAAEALRAAEAMSADIRSEGCEPHDPVYDVELLGDHPWARRVRVEVPYRHARRLALEIGGMTFDPADCAVVTKAGRGFVP